MEMKNRITIINFSTVLTQEDAINGENSTQKGALINYLMSRFPNISIDIIGLNTNFLFNVEYYRECKSIKLPNKTIPIFSSVLFNFTSFLYVFLKPKPSIIYIYSSSESLPYIGALIYAKLFKIPFFFNIRNPPESLCSFEDLTFIKKLIVKILDEMILKFSDKIIHISEKSKDLLKYYPRLYSKSIVMGSCPNNIFLESDRKNIIGNNELVFAYWGIMERTRNLDIIIKGFMKAKKLNDQFEAKFYLFGGGEDLDRLKELVKKLKTPDIIFGGYVGQEELYKFLHNISGAVVPIPPKEIYQYSSPLKLAEAVAIELPMIASNIEPNKIVEEHKLGILCEHDVDSYAQAFLKFCDFSDYELNEFRENCKKIKYLFTPENVFREVREAIVHEMQPRRR